MKQHPRINASAPAATVCLLALSAASLHAVEQTHPAEGTSTAGTTTIDQHDQGTDDVQSPPGHVGAHWPRPVDDSRWFSLLLVDQLEYRMQEGIDTVNWDIVGWYGGDYNRLWLKTEGEWKTAGQRAGEFEGQALYGRMIAPFWDFQIGWRHDQSFRAGPDRSREFAVIGLEGLAPYWFELEPAVFISQDGDVSARLTATNDLLLTQQFVLQPRLDVDAADRADERFGVGKGLDSIGLGLRLRYEIRRELAPYLGIHWQTRLGETADISRRSGERTTDIAIVFGTRIWF